MSASDGWLRVEALYHAALELDAGERAAFLDTVCNGDVELRRELESLLAEATSGAGFLGRPAVAIAAQILTDSATAMPTLPGGFPQRLGPCRLLKQLGGGGMGTVYLAAMEESRSYAPMGSCVAVKVLHPAQFSAAGAFKRFLREAELGKALRHPAVRRTFDVDAVSIGQATYHFLVLEYVEGRTLQELMRQLKVISEALLRELGAQIARALQAVHEAGAVHRDIKPANILVTPSHQVKIMDLGIAHLLDDAAGLTRSDHFVGTALYAAPEQFGGKQVGPAADLYSLGVVLYEGATGIQPFAAQGLQAVMRRQLDVVPPRAGSSNPQLSPFFEEVLVCLLEKDPAGRFPSAGDLASVLEFGESSPWWHERELKVRSAHPRGELRRIHVRRATTIVGRDKEREILRALYQAAVGGRGQFVLLEGEAGVGKTRLLDEFVREIETTAIDAPHVLYGEQPPEALGRTGALAQAVVNHFGEAGLETGLLHYLRAAPRLARGFAEFLSGVPSPGGPESLSSLSAEGLHAVFCQLARSLAAERPVVWIVEDIHFGGFDSRSLLLTLARIAHDQRLLLLATARPGLPSEELANFERLENARRLTVGRLSLPDVLQILSEMLSSRSQAERLARKVAEETDGNPFFLFEVLREMQDRGVLREGPNGTFTAASDAVVPSIPSSIRELLLARLNGLREEERTILDVGSVHGFAFDPDLAARALGRKRLEILQTLAEVERRSGIVRATGSGFQFDHHLLQEVLYGALPESLRTEYHALLATEYEARAGLQGQSSERVPGEAAVFLAEHFFKGRRLQQASSLVIKALKHLESRYDNGSFLKLAALALNQVGGEDPALRCEVRLLQARVLNRLGLSEVGQATEAAISDARASKDPSWIARACLARGAFLLDTSDDAGAQRALEEAREQAVRGGDSKSAAEALLALGAVHVARGDIGKAQQSYQRSRMQFRVLGDRQGEADAAGRYGLVMIDHRQDNAREAFEYRVSICREIGDREGEALSAVHLGEIASHSKPEEAPGYFELGMTLSREIGLRRGEAGAHSGLGLMFRALGNLKEARAHLEQSLTIYQEIGLRHDQAIRWLSMGWLDLDEGDLDAADRHFNSALDIFHELVVGRGVRSVRLGLGQLAYIRSDRSRARAIFEDVLAHREGPSRLDALMLLGRLQFEESASERVIRTSRQAARHSFREAARWAEYKFHYTEPISAAYLAALDESDPDTVDVPGVADVAAQAEAHLVLHRAGASGDHLQRSRVLLERASAHLSGSSLETFWRNNSIARMLLGVERSTRRSSEDS
jgi:tetratricopeptide (TPR) repeat protein